MLQVPRYRLNRMSPLPGPGQQCISATGCPNGIAITASGVTLDLNGFTISSTAATATGSGVVSATVSDVTVCNGQTPRHQHPRHPADPACAPR